MNALLPPNRSRLLVILLLSFGFHAIVLTLFVLYGFLHPVTPVEDTRITMIRLGSQGGSGNRASRARQANNSTTASNTAQTPKPTPPVTAPKPATPPAPVSPTQAKKPATPAKTNPRPLPDTGGPRVATKTDGKKKTAPPATPSPTTSPPENPTSAHDQKIAEALKQVQQDLQARESGNAGAGSGETTGAGTGGPASGAAGGNIAAADPVLVQYQTQVKQKIIREWIRANTGSESEVLRTRVAVRIDAGGKVISTNFVKKSGNASFDLSAIRAIERASPLPTPPEAIKGEALSEGFVVDFNSRMLGG